MRLRGLDQDVISALSCLGFVKSNATGGISLWIHIQEEGFSAGRSEASGEIDGGGGLADTSFLIRNGDNVGHGIRGYGAMRDSKRKPLGNEQYMLWQGAIKRFLILFHMKHHKSLFHVKQLRLLP